MLHKTKLPTPQQSRDMVQVFKGLNRNLRGSEGEWADMQNMTGDFAPVLGVRKKRGIVKTLSDPGGLIAKDALCYVDDHSLYVNGLEVEGLVLEGGEKTLLGMGAYILIWPDKKWYNTADGSYGSMENLAEATNVTYTMCDVTGKAYEGYLLSDTAPEAQEDGRLWMDISTTPHSLKIYSMTTGTWTAISTVYVKLQAANIGMGFAEYDGVTISGAVGPDVLEKQIDAINGSHVIYARDDNWIVVTGLLDQVYTQEDGTVRVHRAVPDMDFVTESGNRIWGCKYGLVGQDTVNEIYACKLGDFKNWNVFMGISTDSYAASRGSDGPWTGAITLGGYPLFFKENCVEKVYPSSTGAHQIVTTNLRGVQKGSHKSMAVVDEVLYYKSATDICAYDGSLPVSISEKLQVPPDAKNAVAGSLGAKYYICMEGSFPGLCVYDTRSGMWHKHDLFMAQSMCRVDTELFAIDQDNRLIAMTGQQGQQEGDFPWAAESCTIGLEYPDHKYVTRLHLRLCAEGSINILVQYDSSGVWEHKATVEGYGMLRSILVPILPVRCDHMAIRLDGVGDFKLYSITKTLEQGSDEF